MPQGPWTLSGYSGPKSIKTAPAGDLSRTGILTARCQTVLELHWAESGSYVMELVCLNSLCYLSEESGVAWISNKLPPVDNAFFKQPVSSDVRLDDASHLMADVHRCETKLPWNYRIW